MNSIEKLINLSNKLDLQGYYKQSSQIDSLCHELIKSAKTNKINETNIENQINQIKLSNKDLILLKEAIFNDFFSGLGQVAKNTIKAPFKPLINISVFNKVEKQLSSLINSLTNYYSQAKDEKDLDKQLNIRRKLVQDVDAMKLYFSEIAASNKSDRRIWTLSAMTSESLMRWEDKQGGFSLPIAINDLRNVLLKIRQGTYVNQMQEQQRKQPNHDFYYHRLKNEEPKRKIKKLPEEKIYEQLNYEVRDKNQLSIFHKNTHLYSLMYNEILNLDKVEATKIAQDFFSKVGHPKTPQEALQFVTKIRAENNIF